MCLFQRVEALEREEEEAGARITVKKKKGGKGKNTFRQTKLTTGGEKNSLEVTKPSPFAENIEPTIPEFNANPKKAGAGRKRAAKAEPKGDSGASSNSLNEGGELPSSVPRTDTLEDVKEKESKVNTKPSALVKKKSKTVILKPDDEDSDLEILGNSNDDDVSCLSECRFIQSHSTHISFKINVFCLISLYRKESSSQ